MVVVAPPFTALSPSSPHASVLVVNDRTVSAKIITVRFMMFPFIVSGSSPPLQGAVVQPQRHGGHQAHHAVGCASRVASPLLLPQADGKTSSPPLPKPRSPSAPRVSITLHRPWP